MTVEFFRNKQITEMLTVNKTISLGRRLFATGFLSVFLIVFCADLRAQELTLTDDDMQYNAGMKTISVDGDISGSFLSTDDLKLFSSSFTPIKISLYLSVFAVHITTILSSAFFSLKSLMSARIRSICSFLLPFKQLSALADWFAAMKFGSYIPGRGFMFFM